MTQFDDVKAVDEHMEASNAAEIAVHDARGALWLIAPTGDGMQDGRLFYQGLPQGDEDGNRESDGTGWLLDGIMTDGPSWPLRLLLPAGDPINDQAHRSA